MWVYLLEPFFKIPPPSSGRNIFHFTFLNNRISTTALFVVWSFICERIPVCVSMYLRCIHGLPYKQDSGTVSMLRMHCRHAVCICCEHKWQWPTDIRIMYARSIHRTHIIRILRSAQLIIPVFWKVFTVKSRRNIAKREVGISD